jgi:protein kinase-like protein
VFSVFREGEVTLYRGVLEDPGGEPLDRLLGRPLEVTQFLRIAIPLAATLRQMHERSLIHKDIKPANVLVDLASGRAWLTGFGIASRLPREHRVPEPPATRDSGTATYQDPCQFAPPARFLQRPWMPTGQCPFRRHRCPPAVHLRVPIGQRASVLFLHALSISRGLVRRIDRYPLARRPTMRFLRAIGRINAVRSTRRTSRPLLPAAKHGGERGRSPARRGNNFRRS